MHSDSLTCLLACLLACLPTVATVCGGPPCPRRGRTSRNTRAKQTGSTAQHGIIPCRAEHGKAWHKQRPKQDNPQQTQLQRLGATFALPVAQFRPPKPPVSRGPPLRSVTGHGVPSPPRTSLPARPRILSGGGEKCYQPLTDDS